MLQNTITFPTVGIRPSKHKYSHTTCAWTQTDTRMNIQHVQQHKTPNTTTLKTRSHRTQLVLILSETPSTFVSEAPPQLTNLKCALTEWWHWTDQISERIKPLLRYHCDCAYQGGWPVPQECRCNSSDSCVRQSLTGAKTNLYKGHALQGKVTQKVWRKVGLFSTQYCAARSEPKCPRRQY